MLINSQILLNSDERVPDTFYVFVTNSNVVTRHNLKFAGGFSSAAFGQLGIGDFSNQYQSGDIDYFPFVPNHRKDMHLVSMFTNHVTAEYKTEYNCEVYRKEYFPTYPSRFSAVYAFGDFESCEAVSKKYGWSLDEVKRFRLQPNTNNRIAKVNMEVISLYRCASRVSYLEPETENKIWHSYWTSKENITLALPTVNGSKEFEGGLIWEYLIEGHLLVIDK